MIHMLKYGYSSQKGNSQTNVKSFPSGIYPSITLMSLIINHFMELLVCLLGVDYKLILATLCTRSDILVIHSPGYILIIARMPSIGF